MSWACLARAHSPTELDAIGWQIEERERREALNPPPRPRVSLLYKLYYVLFPPLVR